MDRRSSRAQCGRRQFDERFEKFMSAALKLVTQRGDDIQYVDMRYTNGFAIGWRGGAAVATSQKDGLGAVCPACERRWVHQSDEDGGRDA